jgi:phage terminase large subunit-like protein
MNLETLSRDQKIQAIALLQEKSKRDARRKCINTYNSFYAWQKEFCAATKDHFESCLCAANQIGKTYTGTTIDAMHLLGDYPDDYPGHKFDFPPLCWGLGYSMEKTRDLLQSALFGEYLGGEFSGGLIPPDRVLNWESAMGTPNAMRTVRVKHKLGISVIQFWSYSQGQHAIMGDVVDWFHVDEEPRDQSIRPQVLTRTINGDKGKGGRGIYTFTPENGRTDLVIKFMDDPAPSQFFMKKGWNDAPHMTQEKRERLLGQYPEHQRKMRTEGEPLLGTGRIYDIADEFIKCEPFEIPAHWFVINGMDFGWDHPQSQVQIAIDRDTDSIYVVKAWKQSRVSANDAWGAVKSWSDGIPTAWPHDGLQNEKGRDDATQQKEHYAKAGFKMLPKMASWPEVPDGNGGTMGGGNSVEQGLYEIADKMRKGQFKVFSGLHDVFDEIRQYHRDEKEKIVKVRDDILDAIRYAYMMRRFAVRIGEIGKKQEIRRPSPIKTMGTRR